AAAIAALAAGLIVWTMTRPAPITRSTLRFQVSAPAGLALGDFFSISPDGRLVAMTLPGERGSSLWIHSIETGQALELTRANPGNTSQVWSPDSRFIAYLGSAGVMRTDVSGGAPDVVA